MTANEILKYAKHTKGNPLLIPALASLIAGGLISEEVLDFRLICSATRHVRPAWSRIRIHYTKPSIIRALSTPSAVRDLSLFGDVKGDGIAQLLAMVAPNLRRLSTEVRLGSPSWVNLLPSWDNLRELDLEFLLEPATNLMALAPDCAAAWRLETLNLALGGSCRGSGSLVPLALFTSSILDGGSKTTLVNFGFLFRVGLEPAARRLETDWEDAEWDTVHRSPDVQFDIPSA